MTRLHDIRAAVNDISTTIPDDPDGGAFWFHPDRGHTDYYRLADDDAEPRYDIWLVTEADFDKAGFMQVEIAVAFYNCELDYMDSREVIVGNAFDGYDQPREQMFLLNLHHYEQQAREKVEKFASWAEAGLESERVEA